MNNTSSGPVPPTVATSYTTDLGIAVPSANILDVKALDVTTNNANGIQTRGGASTQGGASNDLEIQLTNRLQGTGSTTGVTTADIITFSLGATPGCYKFTFEVTGFESTTPAGLGYQINASARTDGVSATVISTPDGDEDEDAVLINADWDVIESGNNVILRVTGVAVLTISWSAVGYYVYAS